MEASKTRFGGTPAASWRESNVSKIQNLPEPFRRLEAEPERQVGKGSGSSGKRTNRLFHFNPQSQR